MSNPQPHRTPEVPAEEIMSCHACGAAGDVWGTHCSHEVIVAAVELEPRQAGYALAYLAADGNSLFDVEYVLGYN